jgi:hypothetical protein
MVDFIDVKVTAATSMQLADDLNAAFAAGELSAVNGSEVVSRFGQPVARAWQNGTVSVTVRGRTPRKINDLYVKVGGRLVARCAD